ncbi:MAG: alpha-amylase family glycosyl hydrolase [bacterium]
MRRPLLALLLALWCAVPAAAAPRFRPIADDVFYQIMPIAWRDSNNDAQRFGDFGGMTASLPYLRSLGVTALWMTPIFPSPAYHGYQHGRADQINPWFGSEAQFLSFVQAAHAESIKVFIDFVAYHVSHDTPYFTGSFQNPASPYTPWLAYTNAANTTYDGAVYTTWNGSSVGQIRWRNSNPAVASTLKAWTARWLDPNGDGDPSDGIDGFRLDHVLPDKGLGYDLAWWQQWKDSLRTVYPDVFSFAEQADWGSRGAELLGPHDATFTKPFLFAARSAIASGSAAGLYQEMAATVASLPPGRTYLGSLGDHDVDRLVTGLGNDVARARVAAAVLMLQPFPPVIYYGDEIGMRGAKADFGSDNSDIPMREPFKWNAVAGPPMSNYFVLNSTAYNARVSRNNDGRSVQEQSGVAGSLLETYRALGALRRAHAALRRGRYDAVPAANPATWAFARTAPEETLLVAIHLAPTAATVNLDLSGFALPAGGSAVRDVVSGATLAAVTAANQSAYPVSMPASGHRVLSVRLGTPVPPPPSPWDGAAIPNDLGAAALVATQVLPTTFGDNVSELDRLYVQPRTEGLAVGITGNLATDGSALALFLDTAPGGQDSLATASFPQPPAGMPQANGLGFDTGFAPDLCLWVNAYGGNLYLDLFTLATGGGGSKRYLGSGVVGSAQPALTGGSNPAGLLASLSNANTGGVTNTSATDAPTATSGFEALLPWADLGRDGPGTPLKLLATIVRPDGQFGTQFLPPLAPGTAPLGYTPFSLKTVPGMQYATIDASLSAPPRPRPTTLALASTPNPFRDETVVTLALAREGDVTVEVLDVSGRRVRTLAQGARAAGAHALRWDGRDEAGRVTPAGLYLVRARTPESSGTLRIARVR